jgi:hypothetical protein
MTPLALTGKAISVAGAPLSKRRMLLRLRSPDIRAGSTLDERDGALAGNSHALAAAKDRGFTTAVLFEDAPAPGDGGTFDVVVRLGRQFEYLRDGDIIGLDSGSRQLRVLFDCRGRCAITTPSAVQWSPRGRGNDWW